MMSDKMRLFISGIVLLLVIFGPGCGRSAKKTSMTDAKAVEIIDTSKKGEAEPEKTVVTKVEPEKVIETKVEPEKTVETKVEPEKTVETKVEPEKTVVTKVEPGKNKAAVTLALKFTPDDLTTYKVTSEAEKSVLWDGPPPSKPSAFKGGSTSNKIEMTFAQRIKSVDDKGIGVAEITIKQLKYLAKVRDSVVLDFDSSRQADQDSPLTRLIGQSYSIEVTPSGQVSKIIDIAEAQAVVAGSSQAHKAAQSLLAGEVIKQRHTIPALPTGETKQYGKGDKWSSLKTFDFGMMGSKSYERVYELEGVQDSDKGKIALAKMKAVPSSENAAELYKEQSTGFLSKLFDNTEEYTGRLKLDLSAGKVDEYTEELKSQWLAVDPESVQKDEKEPAALKMAAIRLYHIERVD
jgi:hypothetical protein